MRRISIRRGLVFVALCIGAALAAPTSAMALSTHSATTSTPNTDGQLVATAKCAANEHVVSGGFSTPSPFDVFGDVASRAVRGGWKVSFWPSGTTTLTTYAYCAPNGQLSLSRHENQVTAGAAPSNSVATATCASGQALISGGWTYSPSTVGENSPTYRNYAKSASKWTVMSAIELEVTPAANLTAFAYCGRKVVVKVRSASSAIADGTTSATMGSATVSCHRGEMLLAGGYTTTPTPDWDNTGPDLFYSASYRSGRRSWTASASNYGGVGTITAFAYCEPKR